MQVVSIEIYALKSKRKNSKYEEKHFQIFPNSKKLKKRFTPDNRADLEQWAIAMEKKGYNFFQVIVTDGINTNGVDEPIFVRMHDWNETPYSMDIAIGIAENFMELYNHALYDNTENPYKAQGNLREEF